MKCPKCNFQNEHGDHFCANCGGPLARHIVEKRGVPYWAVGLIILCCLTLGALGYSYLHNNNQVSTSTEQTKELVKVNKPDNKDEVEIVEPNDNTDKTANTDTNTAQQAVVAANEPIDKISLIKQVSEKVFTIVAGDLQGTGFLYKKGGYIVTNAHVVQGYVDVTVRNSNKEDVSGKVIGISDQYDIALIKVDAYKDVKPLPYEKEESPVGLEVIAFGSPHGFENTASIGYITGTGRDMQSDFVYNQLYQIDAQVDSGSSGGPLVDAKTGNVIGINSLVYTDNHSFAFAIPLYTMLSTIDPWIQKPLTEDVVLQIGNSKNYDNAFNGQEEEYFDVDVDQIDIVENYILLYSDYYEKAVNKGEFFWVADMLHQDTDIYKKVEQEITDISNTGDQYTFDSNEVVDITFEENTYYVTTNEVYSVKHKDGKTEDFDIYKTYTVIVDDEGSVYITDIVLMEVATEE